MMFGAIYWPLTLFFGCLSLYVGVLRARGIARIIFIASALLLIADAGLGIYYAITGH
ncbi:hypothetical protein [Burkholderia multivorans]|uniref:hypothetical protein n=2 Tax=Burkholderia multivorans TaxID=87883 RepID=UPI001C65B391|nr:hypothetical protein [Burkholderia multivorans]